MADVTSKNAERITASLREAFGLIRQEIEGYYATAEGLALRDMDLVVAEQQTKWAIEAALNELAPSGAVDYKLEYAVQVAALLLTAFPHELRNQAFITVLNRLPTAVAHKFVDGHGLQLEEDGLK